MKFCGKCGVELKDDAKFCASCGSPSNSTPKADAAKEPKRKSKAPIIGVAIALVVVLVAGFSAVRWYNSPEQQAIRAVDVSDYASVLTLVTRNRTLLYNEVLVNKLSDRIDELTDSYTNESLEYGLVITELEVIEALNIPGIAEQMAQAKQSVDNMYRERNYVTVYALTKETSFHANEKSGEIIYSYDDQGLLIQIDVDSDPQESWNEDLGVYEYITCADGVINHLMLFEYDDNGNISKMSRTHPQDNIYRPEDHYEYKYEYDENGNIRTCTEYYGGDLSHREYKCTFQWENGLLIQENLSSSDRYGINTGSHSYTYDDKGRIITYCTDEYGESIIANLSYNSSDKVEKVTSEIDGNPNKMTFTFSYDSQGNFIPDAETGIEHIEYDEHGNILVIQFDGSGRVEYEYEKMLVSPELIWNGSAIAAIRQFEHTEDPNRIVSGWNHVACIYALG